MTFFPLSPCSTRIVFAWIALGAATPVGAQVSVGSSALPIDTIVQPGHLEFTRYSTPGACLQAAGLASAVARAADVDSGRYAPDRNGVPNAAASIATACGERFTLQNTPAAELFNLAELAQARGDLTLADSAAERWLRQVRDTSAAGRGWAMLDVLSLYISGRPMRLAKAEAVARRIHALGPLAAAPRMVALAALSEPATRTFNVQLMQEIGLAAFAIDSLFSPVERNNLLAQTDDYSPGGAVIGNRLSDFAVARWYDAPTDSSWGMARVIEKAGFRSMPEDSLVAFLRTMEWEFAPRQLSPLRADRWFGAQGEHQFPTPGRLSVIVDAANDADVASIRRLHHRYGDSLVMTLLWETQGFFRDSPPLEPEQEIAAVRKYFLDDLKLPVNLAVGIRPFHRLADGRRANDAYTWTTDSAYSTPWGYPSIARLVDQRGRSLAGSMAGLNTEPILERYIDRALGRTSQ